MVTFSNIVHCSLCTDSISRGGAYATVALKPRNSKETGENANNTSDKKDDHIALLTHSVPPALLPCNTLIRYRVCFRA